MVSRTQIHAVHAATGNRLPLRVLHVIPSVSPARGGPSFAVVDMARGLAAAGLEVDIASTDDDDRRRLKVPLQVPIRTDGYTQWYFPRQSRFYGVSLAFRAWLAKRLPSYAVVHIHGLFSHASVQAALIARRTRVPYVVRPVGTLEQWGMRSSRPGLKRLSLWLLERRILEDAAAVHFTSRREQQEAELLCVAMKSRVIPLGIDVEPYLKLDGNGWLRRSFPRRLIALFLSRLHPKKGADLLLSAFALVKQEREELLLVMAGDGPVDYVAHLKQQAAGLGVASDVLWAGFLASSHQAEALADADIFVLPSYSENFARAAVEAMAAGTAVVVSSGVGIAESIKAAGAGVVVEPTVESLTAGLQCVIEDKARQRMSERSRLLATQAFSREAMCERLVSLYDDVLSL
jgi:glycosyltransferase involved in cell wall biosynthesis